MNIKVGGGKQCYSKVIVQRDFDRRILFEGKLQSNKGTEIQIPKLDLERSKLVELQTLAHEQRMREIQKRQQQYCLESRKGKDALISHWIGHDQEPGRQMTFQEKKGERDFEKTMQQFSSVETIKGMTIKELKTNEYGRQGKGAFLVGGGYSKDEELKICQTERTHIRPSRPDCENPLLLGTQPAVPRTSRKNYFVNRYNPVLHKLNDHDPPKPKTLRKTFPAQKTNPILQT